VSDVPPTRPCPGCGKPVTWGPDARFRPFCSERCQVADLGAWASERYRVPAADPPDEPPATDAS
jgi:endogenous inhibitor of DNA gyrase (YacG/DUF329 family)